MSRTDRQEIEHVLRHAWDPRRPESEFRSTAGALLRLLRTGAGEEALVESLGEVVVGRRADQLVPLARDLLRIGVKPRGSWRDAVKGDVACSVCSRSVPFCWACPCGFRICQDCMEENRWGMTCNNITWECPDCGGFRGF